jgi:ketosteroid isomerase-like protein
MTIEDDRMTQTVTTEQRADALARAVTMTAAGDATALDEVFTDDVSVWSPGLTLWSRDELADELRHRDQVFTGLAVALDSVDVVGDRGYAEWTATVTHAAPMPIDDELVAEPTGTLLTLRGVTVAAFAGDRIVALRQYWDEVGLLEGLGLLPTE